MPDFQMLPSPDDIPGFKGLNLMETFVKTITRHPEEARSNRLTGLKLILLTEACGYTNVAAYRLVRPGNRASDENAAEYVRKIKKHHRENYPLSINEALEVHGVTIEWIIEKLKGILNAKKLRWNAKRERYEETEHEDHRVQLQAMSMLLRILNLDEKARQEVAIGKAETKKMNLNTGMKFDTIEAWMEYMEGQDEKLLADRALAAKEMKLIAAGHQIIQKEGEEAAKKMKQAALDAGLTGDEDDD